MLLEAAMPRGGSVAVLFGNSPAYPLHPYSHRVAGKYLRTASDWCRSSETSVRRRSSGNSSSMRL